MNINRQAYLFQHYFNKTATQEEIEEFMLWASQEENTEKLKVLMNGAWEGYHEKNFFFTTAQSKELLNNILRQDLKKYRSEGVNKRKRNNGWLKAAAVILVILSIGYCWYAFNKKPLKTTKATAQINNDVAPGGNKAILKLANGSTIALDSVKNGQLAKLGTRKVVKVKTGLLAYNQASSHTSIQQGEAIKYNTLVTPRGGQYQLILPDGSKVWLNAASSIRFPTAFTGTERKVEIIGEAYFEVAKNAAMPFKVNANNINVSVLGTHFNVNAYKDEPSIKTTLLEGMVKIAKGNVSAILKPGQQANIKKGATSIKVTKADIDEAVAWKNGLFHFDGDDISSIMRKISRWYDVKVNYEGNIPVGHYTGIITRDTNLSEVLKMLELSGIHFKITGRSILVMS